MGDFRHHVMGRAAVRLTAFGLGAVGVASLVGVDVSRSFSTATDGAMVVDLAWSVLLVLGAALVLTATLAGRRTPDPQRTEVVLERVGVLFLVTGIVVFLGAVMLAVGVSGALMTVVSLSTQAINVACRQFARSPRFIAAAHRTHVAVASLRGRA